MFCSVRGALFAVAAVAIITAVTSVNKSANWSQAKATVDYIDRTCDFTETTYEGKKPVSSRHYTDSCGSTDEFEKIKEKRNKMVSGRATVHVSYTAPNGSYQTGEFKMTGTDDDFYTLKAGDSVEIEISKSDPTRIKRT